jgi:hypothetical protein
MATSLLRLLPLALLCGLSAPALAQQGADSARTTPALPPLTRPGEAADERLRVEQLLGLRPADGFLLRSTSSLAAARPGSGLQILPPVVRVVRNSQLPLTLNQGALWAGRGWNAVATGGIRARYGRATLTLAPAWTYQQNLDFQVLPNQIAGRDSLASRWYSGSESLDLPQRFGGTSFQELHWGETSLTVDLGPAVVGAGAESQWWGPGSRNGLILSTNAPGIPHLFARTGRPLASPLGRVEGKWMLGMVDESPYFDGIAGNDRRSFGGLVVTLSPRWEPNLTLGVARVVYADLPEAGHLPLRALDPVLRFSPTHATEPGDSAAARDQISAAFARWIFPASGFEAYAEVTRTRLPESFRDLLTAPEHSLGYTLGAQWARPLGGGVLRLHPELTHLEQSSSFGHRPVLSYYASRTVPQGYTHRGRVIGAGIGPGASSQWLVSDYLAPSWHLGVFGGRIRWNNNAYFRWEPNLGYAHDVSLLGGIRAGHRTRLLEWSLEVGTERRYNYLFQNKSRGFDGEKAVDIVNRFVRLTLHPLPRR